MGWLRQHLVALEYNTNVLAFWVLQRVFVVFYVAGLGGVDGVVASHAAVVAWEPFRAALAEDDVARDHVLFCVQSVVSLLFFAGLVLSVCLGFAYATGELYTRHEKVMYAHILMTDVLL